MSSQAPLLCVEDLSAGYDGQPVLDGVSFTVSPGEIVAVIGATGSGKSTVLRCIVGLLAPSRGRVLIRGRDVHQTEGHERDDLLRHVGMAFQEAALLNSMSTVENVALPIAEHWRVDEETALMLARMHLSRVGLAGAGRKLPSELSGGMRKRAGIARAMALDPSLLLLDEPTSGLDPTTARAIDELVLRVRDASAAGGGGADGRTGGMGIVVVSHEVGSIRTIADRVVMLRAGRVIARGSLSEVEASPEPYVRAFFERELVEGERRASLADELEQGREARAGALP